MNAFRRARELLTFTKNEQKIFFFLSVVFLAGAGIKAYRMAVQKPEEPGFDYQQTDSVFAARSALAVGPAHPAGAKTGKNVDLNRATARDLMQLPGIGVKMAARIVDYRTEHGGFRSADELKHVSGIGKKKFEKIRSFITVHPDSATRVHAPPR
jgi:comEA protein